MKGIFHNIPKWQATAIRHELQLLFGSEPTYFRYRRGEYLITPERQAEIAAIFARYGYTQPLQYDHMKTAYYFPSPGFGTYHSNKTRHTYEKLSRLS